MTAKRHSSEWIADAIAPLLKMRLCSESAVEARAAQVGVSGRTLRRWIAAAEGRGPGETGLAKQFPAVALIVAAKYQAGASACAIHEFLAAEWASLNLDGKCPSYSTILSFLRWLDEAEP
ncbi:MAG: hypothetical protein WA789_20160 [Candidatus Acidiferrum sp.]